MPQSEPEFGVNDMAEFAKFDAYAEREEGAELGRRRTGARRTRLATIWRRNGETCRSRRTTLLVSFESS
jgi:hypothetical protein